jgi:hypothetical protein
MKRGKKLKQHFNLASKKYKQKKNLQKYLLKSRAALLQNNRRSKRLLSINSSAIATTCQLLNIMPSLRCAAKK